MLYFPRNTWVSQKIIKYAFSHIIQRINFIYLGNPTVIIPTSTNISYLYAYCVELVATIVWQKNSIYTFYTECSFIQITALILSKKWYICTYFYTYRAIWKPLKSKLENESYLVFSKYICTYVVGFSPTGLCSKMPWVLVLYLLVAGLMAVLTHVK